MTLSRQIRGMISLPAPMAASSDAAEALRRVRLLQCAATSGLGPSAAAAWLYQPDPLLGDPPVSAAWIGGDLAYTAGVMLRELLAGS